ncbi:contact-dependent growth inhibition system immunity protein [Mycobacterium sp. 21AC1]|uniref:contact-dependent growth inhibition system immunity protein n=1 Tax=[Mycobacterium] appelbergii TaxID=2939269 RepID=UPI002938F9C2|nr:contact-dependent growth inhibition system immunity protein [Mycobacterium sp. 21AC1]MDV3130184.1 contact-dependent growth inhibition system immunity protein [Mycobacterium sp. 21AC1]
MNDGSISTDLYQFFGAYFHQDWDLEADDWEGIVDKYSASSTRTSQQLQALATHLDKLLDICPDSELPGVMMEMGGFYDPRPEMTYTEWLGQVADRLRQQAAAIDNSS